MKNFIKRYKTSCYVTFLVLMALAGYFLMTLVLNKPCSENTLDYLEQVAYDVYEQKNNIIVEAPQDVEVTINSTNIEIKTSKWNETGKVIASLENGELVIERTKDRAGAITLGVLLGVVFFLIGVLILFQVEELLERKTNKKNKKHQT